MMCHECGYDIGSGYECPGCARRFCASCSHDHDCEDDDADPSQTD